VSQQVLPLPGHLDDVPVFNSNSPEVVRSQGILLSTFPGDASGKAQANLNYPVQGRVDLFFHHIANGIKARDYRTLYIACLVGNATSGKVTVRTHRASSYLSQPDAPFIELASVLANQHGRLYAGPGDRVALDFLRHHEQKNWRSDLVLAPGEQRLLFCLPIPERDLGEPINGRSGLLELQSNGPVYLATLAMFGEDPNGHDAAAPPLYAWEEVLKKGELAGRREGAPPAPDVKGHIR
jgi:hypothetical protein